MLVTSCAFRWQRFNKNWLGTLAIQGFPLSFWLQWAVNSLIKPGRQHGTTLLFTVPDLTVLSSHTSKQQNSANWANTMAATTEYISVKNRNVLISRTAAQVDNPLWENTPVGACSFIWSSGGFVSLLHIRFQLRYSALISRVGHGSL